MSAKKLTQKQRMFVSEYLVDMNATQAAIRAGYSKKTSGSIGQELLKKPEIQAAIMQVLTEREKKNEITADKIDQALASFLFLDTRKLFNSDGTPVRLEFLDDDVAKAIAGIDVTTTKIDDDHVQVMKYKFPDRIRAAELLYRRKGLLKDRTEFSGPDGQPLPPTTISLLFVSPPKEKGSDG